MIKSWNTDNVEIALRDVSDPFLYLICNSFLPREFLLVIAVGFHFLLSDFFPLHAPMLSMEKPPFLTPL